MAIPDKIKQLANDIRTKIYGRDVRESLAQGIEEAGSIADDANIRSVATENRQNYLEQRFEQQIQNMTLEDPSSAEIVDARTKADGTTFPLLKNRLDYTDEHTVKKLRPLGNGQDDAPQINEALSAPTDGIRTVILEGDFYIGSALGIGDNTVIDARGATITALPNCGYMLQTREMLDHMLLCPRTPSATASETGGTLQPGTYAYRISAVTVDGKETVASPEVTAKISGTTGSVTLSWSYPRVGPAGIVSQYKVWGRKSGQIDTLLGTVPASQTTFTDTGQVGTSGQPPVINTTFGRTKNITIIGGIWDCNSAENPNAGSWVMGLYVGHAFDLQKVDNLTIKDVTIKNAAKWAIAIADFTNLRTENLTFDTDSDGIHVLGPGNGWYARNIYGTTGDDLVGISCVEWPNYAVSEGDISNVTVENIHGINAPSAVRMLGGSGRKFDNIKISGVRGTYGAYSNGTIGYGVIFINAEQLNPGRAIATAGSIIIEDVKPESHLSDLVNIAASCDLAVVRNLRSSSGDGKRAFYTDKNANGNVNIKRLLVDDVECTNPTGYSVVLRGENVSIEDAELRNVAHRQCSVPNNGPIVINIPVKRLRIANPTVIGIGSQNTEMIIISNSAANIEQLNVDGYYAENINAVVYALLGTIGKIDVGPGVAKNCQAIVKTKIPIEVGIRGGNINTLSTAIIALYSSTASAVIHAMSGITVANATYVFRDGTQSITAKDFSVQMRVDHAAKVAGSMLYNILATLPSGVGPHYFDGTVWKNIVTGATWTPS